MKTGDRASIGTGAGPEGALIPVLPYESCRGRTAAVKLSKRKVEAFAPR